jgi:hypothetical protein
MNQSMTFIHVFETTKFCMPYFLTFEFQLSLFLILIVLGARCRIGSILCS